MTITMELSYREVRLLKKMISDVVSYEKISSVEEALRECIRMAMFGAGDRG